MTADSPAGATPAAGAAETIAFQAEARQLLQLVIHSIYSNRDVFLRELVSNASDALDKVRLESYRDDLTAPIDVTDLHVELAVDRDARTLTVRDNGIGMTRDEVVGLIGTIAKSGTAELLAALRAAPDGGDRESAAAQELIGRFGVGFYSSFMVADRVELLTRKAGTTGGVAWSSEGDATFTVADVADAPQGTTVTLHLKPADPEDGLADYTDEHVLRRIVTRYSDFITWPIRLQPATSTAATAEGEDPPEPAVLNRQKALWARPRAEVTEEEYAEFYRHVSHDWNAPLETIRLAAEGTFEYQALLFLPARAPMDLFLRERRRGVQLYVRRVFVMDDCEALVPEYLRFVKGVVDAADLSLNVSRELLQADRQIQLIRKRLVRKVLETIATLQSDEPEKYATLWSELGRALKEGLLEDPDHREQILKLCSFASTADPDALTTLTTYKERMGEGQERIYYQTGESRAAIENSPHMESLRAKGYEVLLLTDPIDEIWVEQVAEFDGTPLTSIGSSDATVEGDAVTEQETERFAALAGWLTEQLSDDVREVRLTGRLTDSPAVLVGEGGDMTPTLERMYRSMGQDLPKIKRILELNPRHDLIVALADAHAARPGDADLVGTARLVHDTALLAEGGDLPEPARFAALVNRHVLRAVGGPATVEPGTAPDVTDPADRIDPAAPAEQPEAAGASDATDEAGSTGPA